MVALGLAAANSARAVTINYASSINPQVKHYVSNGDEIAVDPGGSSGFFFQVGTFTDSFVPTTGNTDSWLAHWTPVTTDAGAELPAATTEYTSFDSQFNSFNAFSGSLDLTHNQAPFTPNLAQGYIWGYDTQDTPGAAEWILLTNSAGWKFPDTNAVGTSTWSVGNASDAETLIGTISRNLVLGDSMHFGQVTIPGAVPEPSIAVLATMAIATAGIARRRRRRI